MKAALRGWVLAAAAAGIGAAAASAAAADAPTATPTPAPAPALAPAGPALLLVGDSTLAPRSGYGDALCARLAPAWACLNLARGGRSTKSYREEGLWQAALQQVQARRGEGGGAPVVLIQFGHNDQPGKPGRSTDLATEFPANLQRYVQEARAAGGLPVLGTPLTRRSFKNAELQDDLGPWAEATRRVARELGVPLVDTLAVSAARVQALGEAVADTLAVAAKPAPGVSAEAAPGSGSQRFDRTHVGPRGACLFAALAAPLLAQAVPALRAAFLPGPDEAACLALPAPPPAAALPQAPTASAPR